MSSQTPQRITFSQNYIKDRRLAARLVERANLCHSDVVIEIGPGKGIITGQLARVCGQVIAVEKDPQLASLLIQQFGPWPNVTIQEGDFLAYRLPRFPYKVFSNIPFNITSAVIARLTAAAVPPEEAYLVLQKEAADTLRGAARESLRSVLLKPWFEPKIVHLFRRTDFMPAPRVEVVLLHLHKRGPPLIGPARRQLFRDFVVYGFTTWRPTLGETFKGIFTWPQLKHIRKKLGIDLDSTPTAVRFDQWLDLFEYFMRSAGERGLQTVSGSEKRLIRKQRKVDKIHRTRILQ